MDYANLGQTGLKVSRICLGCMTYGAPAAGELKGALLREGSRYRMMGNYGGGYGCAYPMMQNGYGYGVVTNGQQGQSAVAPTPVK